MTVSDHLHDAADSIEDARGEAANTDGVPPTGEDKFDGICKDVVDTIRELAAVAEAGELPDDIEE